MSTQIPKRHAGTGTNATETIQVRVTAQQKARLSVAAERVGLKVSAWLRTVALKAAERDERDRAEVR